MLSVQYLILAPATAVLSECPLAELLETCSYSPAGGRALEIPFLSATELPTSAITHVLRAQRTRLFNQGKAVGTNWQISYQHVRL